MKNNYQRSGVASNAHAGKQFELQTKAFFSGCGIELDSNFKLEIGVAEKKKIHAFDLGSRDESVIVECKSHTWTGGDNVPSAKLTVWNEAMYYFHCAPRDFRKILFVLRSIRKRNGESLASYCIQKYGHLIPSDVEIWEYNPDNGEAQRVYGGS